MKILVVKESGYCYGVKNAIDLSIKTAKEVAPGRIFTLGPLIHNSLSVKMLKDLYNIDVVHKVEEIPSEDAVVIIRTHGASKKNREKLQQGNFHVVDATCPFVLHTQKFVDEVIDKGYFVIILGKKGHPETTAIYESYPGKVAIVQQESDLQNISYSPKICVVFQSTVFYEDYQWTIPRLVSLCKEFYLNRTICHVVIERRQKIEEVAKQSNAMLIIGGLNSSNTQEFAKIANKYTLTYHIEQVEEVRKIDLSDVEVLGIATGTSTPWQFVEETIELLNSKTECVIEQV